MKYQHGDFNYKVTIRDHVFKYPFPPNQFQICNELTHKTKSKWANYISTRDEE